MIAMESWNEFALLEIFLTLSTSLQVVDSIPVVAMSKQYAEDRNQNSPKKHLDIGKPVILKHPRMPNWRQYDQ
jgi:hypothetical protein